MYSNLITLPEWNQPITEMREKTGIIVRNAIKYYTFYIPISRYFRTNATNWSDLKEIPRKLLQYVIFIVKHRRNTNKQSKDESIIDLEEDYTWPLYYLEKCFKNNLLQAYRIHLIFRTNHDSLEDGVEKSLAIFREASASRKRNASSLDNPFGSQMDLVESLKWHVRSLEDSPSFDQIQSRAALDRLTSLDSIGSKLVIQNLFETATKYPRETELKLPENLILLQDLSPLKMPLPHSNSILIPLIETIVPLSTQTNEPVIIEIDEVSGNLEHPQRLRKLSINQSRDVIQSLVLYNEAETEFTQFPKLLASATSTTKYQSYKNALETHWKRGLTLFQAVISPNEPKEFKDRYSLPLNALRSWIFAGKSQVYFFHRWSRSRKKMVPQPLKIVFEKESVFSNWTRYLLEGIVTIAYSSTKNNSPFLALFDGSLSQWSNRSDTETTLYKHNVYLQGATNTSKTFLFTLNKSMSIPGTFHIWNGKGQDITDQRFNYMYWYADETISFTRTRSSSEPSGSMKTLLTSTLVEKLTLDAASKEMSSQSSDTKTTIAIASASSIPQESLRDLFAVFTMNPNEVEIDNLKAAQTLGELSEPHKMKEFISFHQDLLSLVALSNLAITSRVFFPVNTVGARIVLLQLEKKLQRMPIWITVTPRDIDRILHVATNKCIANAWLQTLALETQQNNSEFHGNPFSWSSLVECAKRQVITLEILLWSFSQYFETLMNQMVRNLLRKLEAHALRFHAQYKAFYSDVFGITTWNAHGYNYHLDLLALYYQYHCVPSSQHFNVGFAVRPGNDDDYVDLNYFAFESGKFADLMKMWGEMIGKSTVYGERDLTKLFDSPSPRFQCTRVLPYISKTMLESGLEVVATNKEDFRTKLSEVKRECVTRNPLPPLEDIRKTLVSTVASFFEREISVLSQECRDGDSFHRNLPNHIYQKKSGLPMFRKSRKDSHFEFEILVECFLLDPCDVLVSAIESMNHLVYESQEISIICNNTLRRVVLPSSQTPYIHNYMRETPKIHEESNSFVHSMHEHSSDDEEDVIHTESTNLNAKLAHQIKKEDRIYFGKMGFDEYFQRLWLEKHGVIEEDRMGKYLAK
jgi:hypothetical protein